MFIYRISDRDGYILADTTNKLEALEIAMEAIDGTVHVRKQPTNGPQWNGANFGHMEFIRSLSVDEFVGR